MLTYPRRTLYLVALSLALAAHAALVQSAAQSPAFDVATIRVVPPDTRITMMGLRYTPDGVDGQSVTVAMLIRAAYGGFIRFPTEDRVLGLPDWAKTTNLALHARMSEAEVADFKNLSQDEKDERVHAMLQSLLADRFQLRVHLESKQGPVYELVVAKGGTKLKQQGSDPDPDGPRGVDGTPITGSFMDMYTSGRMQAQSLTMEQLANYLAQPPLGLGRSVVDRTGLTGKYSFTLNWLPPPGLPPVAMPGMPPPPPPPPPPPGGSPGPSIFTALQEQLGLRLQPATGTIQLIAVDHIDRPTDN